MQIFVKTLTVRGAGTCGGGGLLVGAVSLVSAPPSVALCVLRSLYVGVFCLSCSFVCLFVVVAFVLFCCVWVWVWVWVWVCVGVGVCMCVRVCVGVGVGECVWVCVFVCA